MTGIILAGGEFSHLTPIRYEISIGPTLHVNVMQHLI